MSVSGFNMPVLGQTGSLIVNKTGPISIVRKSINLTTNNVINKNLSDMIK